MSLPVKKIKIGEYLAKLQARKWLCRARAATLIKVEESSRHSAPFCS